MGNDKGEKMKRLRIRNGESEDATMLNRLLVFVGLIIVVLALWR